VWRFATSLLSFTALSELIFGSTLLYSFRIFERHYSSKKFAGCVLFFALFSTAMQLSLLLLFPSIKYVASGPYWLIFGLFVQYYVEIPQSARSRILYMWVSDKSILYLLGAQLLMSSYPDLGSLLSGVSGLAGGLLYRLVPLFSRWRPPNFLTRFCHRFLSPLLATDTNSLQYTQLVPTTLNSSPHSLSTSLSRPRTNLTAHLPSSSVSSVGLSSEAVRPQELSEDGAVVADESAVIKLVQMGFAESEARSALSISANNVVIASTRLIDRHSLDPHPT